MTQASAPPATASSVSGSRDPSGTWQGVVRSPGSAPVGFTLVIDSAGGAWRGSILAPVVSKTPIAIASVARSQDSLVMRLPASGQNAVLRGRIAPDGNEIDGVVDASSGQTFAAARAGTAAGAALAREVTRLDESRKAASIAQPGDSIVAPPRANPDSAALVTSDIARFWSVVDSAARTPDSLAPMLQRDYLERGSVGVRDFIPGRILSAEDLAQSVRDRRARYDSARAAMFQIARADPAIHAAFRRLKSLYPPAVFPDVYFVVGRFNSGGTSSDHGLLIGAEMYQDPARLPAIVSHELIHYQQHYQNRALLEHSFLEGSADFIGEMISGAQINNDAHRYGLAHEHQLWQEFQPHMNDVTYFPWMYGKPTDGRPNDLGYFIGYRIAQAYYNRATDKAKAIRDIITADDGNVRALLAASGYNP